MTENSLFWTTNDTGDGAASGYTAAEWFELWRALFAASTGADLGGVAPSYLNSLVVSGTASPVSVATGAALVYGIPYFNDAALSVAVPTPVTQTRIDRIVLRAVWSTQTVRCVRLAGTEGAGTPPALTQTANDTWEISLATVTITAGGNITVADEREFLQLIAPEGIDATKLADGAVTTAKLADGAVTAAKFADMAAGTVKGRAAGAGTGDPADLTPAQLVAIVTAADGSGSGLDADTLDGSHASAFATSGHNHDASYAATSHNHDSAYSAAVHNHDAAYSAAVHNHDSAYSASTHNHDSAYSAATHNHDGSYAAYTHTHGTSTIDNNAVSNAKLADMAQATVKGRASGAGTGDPSDLSATQLREIVKLADGSGSGLDADTLDTYHASDFAVAAHTHDTAAVSVSGLTVHQMMRVVQVGKSYNKSGSGYVAIGTYSGLPTPVAAVYGAVQSSDGADEAQFGLTTGKVLWISGPANLYYIHFLYLT